MIKIFLGHIQDSSWIGLQYSQGSYLWTDGSSFNFNNWGENRPSNQPCVFMQDTGEWNDAPCNEYHNYVCKKDESKTYITKTSSLMFCILILLLQL